MALSVGLEPTTYGLEGRCSIRLSYESISVSLGSSSDKRCFNTLIVVCRCPVSCGCIRERRISISSFNTDMCSKSLLLNDAMVLSFFDWLSLLYTSGRSTTESSQWYVAFTYEFHP